MEFFENSTPYSGGNRVLDALSGDDCSRIYPLLTVYLDSDPSVLQEREAALDTIYFPLDAVYSIIVQLEDGAGYEVDAVGRGGALNLEALVDAEVAPRTILCQVGGRVAAMSRLHFEDVIKTSSAFRSACAKAFRRQLFITQQTTACNAAHTTLERCSRWILMTAEQVGRNRFPLRLEYFSMMLASDNARVRQVVDVLVELDIVTYHDGIVTVASDTLLREQACECYSKQHLTSFVDLAFPLPIEPLIE